MVILFCFAVYDKTRKLILNEKSIFWSTVNIFHSGKKLTLTMSTDVINNDENVFQDDVPIIDADEKEEVSTPVVVKDRHKHSIS